MTDQDTDVLLALVSSLLVGAAPDANIILDTLVKCNGDVAAAAELLNSHSDTSKVLPAEKKRKRTQDLDGWFKPTSKGKAKEPNLDSNVVAASSSSRTTALPLKASAKISNEQSKAKGKGKEHVLQPLVASSRNSPSQKHVVGVTSTLPLESPGKSVVDLMTVLQQAPSTTKKIIPRAPPLMLSNPSLVAQHTPCTLHHSVLPPELACRLFYTMIEESQSWQRNKWWLFDRLVESPHRTSFYARKNDGTDDDDTWQEAAQFWYNGRVTDPPQVFPSAMEEACMIIERVVNDEMRKRKRFPLEWAGDGKSDMIWRANVAASNCYEGGKESVGPHSDQMTYLGPYCTIASLSLGTRRIFSLREVVPNDEKDTRHARTFNIPLAHNSLTIMHASCQESFKHAIPPQPSIDVFRPLYPPTPSSLIEPSNCRINITFRFYRPDFRPPSIPRCKCGVPTILRADMKNRSDGMTDRYWWACYAGAQNEGKGCNFWKVMDMKAEGRGPVIGEGLST